MEIHIYPELEQSFGFEGRTRIALSVKEIIKNSGQYSGLTLSVKQIISAYTDNWTDCKLLLHRGSRPGWFVIEEIIGGTK